MDIGSLAAARRAEARQSNQRRALVCAGDRQAGLDAAFEALAAAEVPPEETAVVSSAAGTDLHAAVTGAGLDWAVEHIEPVRADRLLGTTQTALVLDTHEGFSPNVLGRLVGAVDGGGLLVLVTPPLAEWPDRRDDFDERLAVPPFDRDDVTGRFRRRLVDTLEAHPGVAIVDVDAGEVLRDGTLDAPSAVEDRTPTSPPSHRFPAAAYEACLTRDQVRAVRALESLRDPGSAVVVEADRGRGKSSAAGLAAGALAAEGRDVLVTAPEFRSAREVFVRARALLETLGSLQDGVGSLDDTGSLDDVDGTDEVTTTAGGRVRFERPPVAASLPSNPDAVVVDEAAAIPVGLLTRLLAAPAAAFCTTVHGYEGAGRGFSVRFRDRLDSSDRTVTERHLDDPIRYARGDPVESWAFRALLLDARPAVDPAVTEATPETTTYRALSPDGLLADEHLLGETFGLLVLAHYRTEPDDLARLLDAPNLAVRALTYDGHVVSVALLAREGDLPAATRRAMFDGHRVRGNMLPDVLTSQVRDEAAGVPTGYRVLRIATHHAVRSRGLGSTLLGAVREELRESDPLSVPDGAGRDGSGSDSDDEAGSEADEDTETDADGRAGRGPDASDGVDWLGVGYGATPELLSFWERNGYRSVYLSTSRNDRSGEYSAVMLDPLSTEGRALLARHTRWFFERTPGVLSDPLDDVDPDVVRGALRATSGQADHDLSARRWQVVVDAAHGPGLYTADPDAFRILAVAHLTAPDRVDLSPRAERLLVRKVLQARPWSEVAEELGYVSTSESMRALGEAYRPLVERYAPDAVRETIARYR
jgi:tRNA(Met) cytidine acetyltransferase